MSISLCIIIKNEEKTLDSFLKKLKPYVNEIIIVDTGSIDKSKEIAKKYTKKIYDFAWCNYFAITRNYSIKFATKDWILWLDPDEEIEIKDLKKLKALTKNKQYFGYRFIQESIINKKKYTQGICKLFQNKKQIKFIYPVHESVMPYIKRLNGKIGKTNIKIKHTTLYNKTKINNYMKLIEKKEQIYPNSNALKEKKILLDISKNLKK
jgi:glycosyltransferase involved in cell wall biosynthesis